MTNSKMNFIYFCSLILTIGLGAFPTQATTSDSTPIIKKVLYAYGGEILINAKSIKIIDHNKGPWPGESENPGIPEIWRINEELTIDFEQKRKSLLSYRVPRTTLDLEKWIFDGKEGIKYDILHQKYSYEEWVTYNNLGGSIIRSSDTMQAKRLNSELKEATYLKDEYFRGKLHQLLAVTLNSGAKFTYYIDKESGIIRKILRHTLRAKIAYVFSNHQVSDGITYASDMNLFVNGALRLTSVKRSLELDPALEETFSKFTDFKPWGETIDNSKMMSKQLAKGVYQAGKGRSLSVFIEQPDYFIAIGGANALKANYDEIIKLAKNDKPLKYFIVTHHHRSNLNSLDNVLEIGAKLVTTKAHQATVSASLKRTHSDDDLVVITDRKPFTLGNLQLFDIATAHSQHYLLAYYKSNKMVIAEEHYETNLKTAKPRIYKDMVSFGNLLKSLNINVDILVDIRSWRQFKANEFKQWINSFTEKTCPDGYEICANG